MIQTCCVIDDPCFVIVSFEFPLPGSLELVYFPDSQLALLQSHRLLLERRQHVPRLSRVLYDSKAEPSSTQPIETSKHCLYMVDLSPYHHDSDQPSKNQDQGDVLYVTSPSPTPLAAESHWYCLPYIE
jgi:hypothetical protein